MPTKIEWCEESWNPVTGCTKISEGCKYCYAERMAKRLAGRFGYPKDEPFKVTLHSDKLNQPLKWEKPRMIFVCSMGDLFHFYVSTQYLNKIFYVMRKCSNHTFLILTKRPESMYGYFNRVMFNIPENIWIGVSVEDQKTWAERTDILRKIPADIKFVSIEPMLEEIDIDDLDDSYGDPEAYPFDWIIIGGESGPHARPMHPDWVRKIRDNCIQTGTPFFFKQWGEWMPALEEFPGLCRGQNQETYSLLDIKKTKRIDKKTVLINVGKKKAGRLLDGREWNQYPESKTNTLVR